MKEIKEAHTKWVASDSDRQKKELQWECLNCSYIFYTIRRYGVKRCPSCERLLEAKNYSVSTKSPDPKNPDWFLEKLAKRRGLDKNHYKKQAQSALEW